VPIFQLSVQPAESPAHHIALGRKLRSLREEGRAGDGPRAAPRTICAPWCAATISEPEAVGPAAFDDWLAETLEKGDESALADYRAPGALCPPKPIRRMSISCRCMWPSARLARAPGGRPLHRSFTLGNLSMGVVRLRLDQAALASVTPLSFISCPSLAGLEHLADDVAAADELAP